MRGGNKVRPAGWMPHRRCRTTRGRDAVYNRMSVLIRTVMIFLAAPPERRDIVYDTGAGSLSARPGDLGPGTDMAAKLLAMRMKASVLAPYAVVRNGMIGDGTQKVHFPA